MRTTSAFALCFALALSLCAPAPVALAAAGPAPSLSGAPAESTGGVRIPVGELVLDVCFVFDDTVRIRMAPASQLERLDRSYAVVAPRPNGPPGRVLDAESGATRTLVLAGDECSARITLRPDKTVVVAVLDSDGNVVVEDDPAAPPRVDPATGAVDVTKLRPRDQFVYGFGEKALPLDRTSVEMVHWNSDTPAYGKGTDPIYQTTPFYIGLRRGKAYGLFFDNTYRSYFNVAKRHPEKIMFGAPGGYLDSYVFCGGKTRDPRQVIRRYTELTGRSQLPPLWALGYQQCRWGYYPEARVREIAARFRSEKIPCDAIYLDIDYMDGYRVFTWDKSRFPDPKRMVGDLLEDGFHTVVIIDPGIKADPAYTAYQSGKAGGHFVRMPDGSEFQGAVWPGTCAFPDFTSPSARDWWGKQFASLVDTGIAGFWTDMNEPSVFLPPDFDEPWTIQHPAKTFPSEARHAGDGDPDSHARYHNVYGQQMTRATRDGVLALAPDRRPFILTRATYAGGQRYAASWTGDNVATWEHLELSIPMLLSMGVSGQALVGADIGGFVDSPTPELYARWLQAAALTPVMRSHTVAGSADQEPFAYGPDFTAINRATIELRYELIPYLYTQFALAEKTGEPVMRPLWLDAPTDNRILTTEDQYLVGRDLLVAPVLRPGVASRRVVFPTGSDWIDWYSGEIHRGGTDATVQAPIGRLPLFARAGSVIPTRAPAAHTSAQLSNPIVLRVFPGASGTGDLFEDSGDGFGYRGDARAETSIRQTVAADGQRTIALSARTGGFRPAATMLEIEIVGLGGAGALVTVDDETATPVAGLTRDGLAVGRVVVLNTGKARTLLVRGPRAKLRTHRFELAGR